jgi:hypothetical protein
MHFCWAISGCNIVGLPFYIYNSKDAFFFLGTLLWFYLHIWNRQDSKRLGYLKKKKKQSFSSTLTTYKAEFLNNVK